MSVKYCSTVKYVCKVLKPAGLDVSGITLQNATHITYIAIQGFFEYTQNLVNATQKISANRIAMQLLLSKSRLDM